MARSMLKSKGMPKEFWVKVVATAVYLSNRFPTRSVWGKTPQEAWSGRKLGISHLKVFGSIAYVHVQEETRKKLDDKSKKLIFIGYMTQTQKGTSFIIPATKRLLSAEI